MDPSARRQAPASQPGPKTTVPADEMSPRRADPGLRRAVLVNWLVLALGGWLMISAFLWGRGTVGGFGAGWSDFLAGAVAAGIAVARITAPLRTVPLGVVTVLLGLWLIAAPYALGYSSGTEAAVATANSRAVGITIALLAMFGMLATKDDRRAR
ncbi:SPW repeat domain-containing protein [Paractinoplanes hotanensis]|uniref:SPW repeat-containing integral membrane domain-containing protein n=1 Tax=Paractinoplanes hotanensis TaxID=2906497 RepID=A0ABT0YDQ5_9ACTN|nr:hypothetical protein [Actinoplanes hotanensis]MCM4083885.1 hypothetical protein [Actinoplanes hotanensis]